MYLDVHELPTAEIEADVCIVGSGAAGITIASELLESGLKVVVLESGGRSLDASSEELNVGINSGELALDLETSRRRAFGGATGLWAGQCIPFEPLDFETRTWVPASGWPFPAVELERYYRRAEAFLAISGAAYGEQIWRASGVEPPALDDDRLIHRCTVYPRRVDLGRLHRKAFERAPNVMVVLRATAVRVTTTGDRSRATGVLGRDLGGREVEVRADRVVLCAGAIENPRLLLLSSTDDGSAGLGNAHGAVGRYLQEHPNGMAADVVALPGGARLQDLYAMFYRRGRRYLPRLTLSASAQERREVLNCTSVLTFEYPDDSGAGIAKAVVRDLRRPGGWRSALGGAGRLAREAPALARIAHRRYVQGMSPGEAPSRIRLQVFTEQAPRWENRVKLGSRRDAVGTPLAEVQWGVGTDELRTARAMVEEVRSEFARLRLGTVVPDPWLTEGDVGRFRDSYHHMGTTRMSSQEATGVVGPDCQVHGTQGLFLAGASVFPTSSYANPTLTAIALAIRLADRLRRPVT